MPKSAEKILSDARNRAGAAAMSLVAARENMDSMELIIAHMSSEGRGTSVAEGLLGQFKQVVAIQTKEQESAESEFKDLSEIQASGTS